MVKKKSTTVKVYRCIDQDCGMFFKTAAKRESHIRSAMHCNTCGFTCGLSAKSVTTDIFCPACRLDEVPFPTNPSEIC